MPTPVDRTYAFIDSQNLNLGVGNDIFYNNKKIYAGWELDFKKFRRFLKDKYHVQTAFLFIGNKPGNEKLYSFLQRTGYVIILKPTTSYKDSKGQTIVKGNVDTDLVLYAAAQEIHNYDKAIIVSGDGDFLILYDYLAFKGKLGNIIIPNKKRYSQLLTKYANLFDFVSDKKLKLEKTIHKKRQVWFRKKYYTN